MQKLFRRADLGQLLAPHPPPCISLLMPTMRHYPETDQNPIRFRNLVRKAEASLGGVVSSPGVRGALDSIARLAEDELWRTPQDGFAVFASPGFLAAFQVPEALAEHVVVADSFHVRPLLKLLAANRRYLLLVLSQNAAQLYEGTAHSLTPRTIGDLMKAEPAREGEGTATGAASPNRHVTRPASGSTEVLGHGELQGHREIQDYRKDEAAKFFRKVDEALFAFFKDDAPPLVLAAPVRDLAAYREVTRYPNLVAGDVQGNFEHATPEELLARAWPAASAHFEEHVQEILGAYDKGVSKGQAVSELSAIARATAEGRVRSLVLAEGERIWGQLVRGTGEVRLHESGAKTGHDDVLDDLAEEVLARKGEVLILAGTRVPDGGPAAALLRW